MRAIKLAEEELAPWLEGSNSNPLVYDQVWGGLIVKNGKSGTHNIHTKETRRRQTGTHIQGTQVL